jgi:hypothetical protein
VYDIANCEVLVAVQATNLDAAKAAAVHFVAGFRFGPAAELKPKPITEMLRWELA